MNISPFDTLSHDPIVVILRRTSLNGLSRIGQTCKTFDQIVRSVFSKNQTDLKSLLDSGKRYVHLIAPCLAGLKTMRAAELLYSEESFIRYAKTLAGTIALKIEENLSGASSVKMDIDRLFGDRELFILLERYHFCQFLAEAFTNKYLASKSSSAFYNRCIYLSETMNRPFQRAGLLLIFEKMYSSYKQALLTDLREQFKDDPEFFRDLKGRLPLFSPALLYYQQEIQGLHKIDLLLRKNGKDHHPLHDLLDRDLPCLLALVSKSA